MKSRIITLSAIAAALVAVALTVGAYFTVADVFSLVVCSAFVVLPLYLNSFKGAVVSYLAGGTLALLLGNFNFLSIIFPSYFAFFGLYPIIAFYLRRKSVNVVVRYVVGAVWCVAFFYGLFFYYTLVMGLDFFDIPISVQWIKDNILYFIWLFGMVFYLIYERYVFVVKKLMDRYLGKIIK